MDKSTAQLLISMTKLKCFLCKEKFKGKYLLRIHLKREHTEVEAEKLIRRIL